MKLLLVLVISAISISDGFSAILAEYNFDNPSGAATDLTSSDTDPNSVAGSVGPGAGFTLITTTPATAFTSDGAGLSDGVGDDLAGAIAADDFFTFTLTADPGFVLDLDQITLDVGNNIRGAQDFFLFTDVGGFTAGSEIDSVVDLPGAGSGNITTDLTGAAFQGLSSIEFRVYVDDRITNGSGASATFLDNIQVTGDAVAIPEPQSWVLSLSILLLGFVFIRHKRSLKSAN